MTGSILLKIFVTCQLTAAIAFFTGCKPAVPTTNPTIPAANLSASPVPGLISGNYYAIDFQLQTLDGKTVKLSDYQGKPVLLNFWATWCGPCRYEVPFLDQINTAYTPKGLVMLAVDIGEDSATIKNFMAGLNVSLPVLTDSDKTIAQKYTIVGIPTTFLIDKDGFLRYKKVGAFQNKAEIETAIKIVMP